MTDMHPNTERILLWIDRMAEKYGGTVYEKDSAKTWDWGQALCRARYGPDWNNVDMPPDPDNKAIRIAREWETGNPPEWWEQSSGK